MSNLNQRRTDESFSDFKARRAAQALAEKEARRNPKILWDSSRRGTYVKAAHGPL